MKLNICIILVFVSWSATTIALAAESANPVEDAMWEYVQDRGDAESIKRFLALYPDSTYAEQAEMLLTEKPKSEKTLTIEATQDGDATGSDTDVSQQSPITFESALFDNSQTSSVGSIKLLSQGSPLFPPVQGLPDEYWKEQNCSNCHEWGKANLCAQGEFLAKEDDSYLVRIEHPYGGVFKKALKDWATNGCL